MLRSGPSFASSVFSLYVVQISSSQSVSEIGVSKKKKTILVGLKIRPMLQFDSSNFYNEHEFFQKVVGLSWELFFFFFCEKLY